MALGLAMIISDRGCQYIRPFLTQAEGYSSPVRYEPTPPPSPCIGCLPLDPIRMRNTQTEALTSNRRCYGHRNKSAARFCAVEFVYFADLSWSLQLGPFQTSLALQKSVDDCSKVSKILNNSTQMHCCGMKMIHPAWGKLAKACSNKNFGGWGLDIFNCEAGDCGQESNKFFLFVSVTLF